MSGRPPKPTNILKMQGTARKDRHAERADLQVESGLPEAPEWLSPEAVEEWNHLVSDSKYKSVLGKVDRAAMAIFCQMMGRFIQGEKKGEPVQVSHVAALVNLGAKLGLNPCDRVKLRLPEPEKPKSAWANLRSGS